MTKQQGHEKKGLDIFRDTPIRYLGYANEVGEAFRQLVPRVFVRFSYVVASTYCFSDALSKALQVKQTDKTIDSSNRRQAIEEFVEAGVWQGLASVIIPGFTINRFCWISGIALSKTAFTWLPMSRQRILVTAIGLGAIPVIIKPIDSLVDGIMDKAIKTSRRFGIIHEVEHGSKYDYRGEHEKHQK